MSDNVKPAEEAHVDPPGPSGSGVSPVVLPRLGRKPNPSTARKTAPRQSRKTGNRKGVYKRKGGKAPVQRGGGIQRVLQPIVINGGNPYPMVPPFQGPPIPGLGQTPEDVETAIAVRYLCRKLKLTQ